MAPKFAFLICGIFQRFFWKDIPLNLVKPLTEKGSTVHIYYSLVNVSTFHVNIGSKEDYKDSAHFHETVFEKSVEIAEGHVKFAEIRQKDFEISDDFSGSTNDIMGMYSPTASSRAAKDGLNVIKRFECATHLYNMAVKNMKAEGQDYDVVGLLREDMGYTKPFGHDMAKWYDANTPNSMYTRDCKRYSALSDKAFLFGKDAARKFLPQVNKYIYNAKAIKEERPDLFGSYHTKNAEQYLQQLAKYLEIKVCIIPFSQLPVSDVVYEPDEGGEMSLCFKKQYIERGCFYKDRGFNIDEKTELLKKICKHH
eukprot:m.68815 g.68815  ORF g.68815 m.68815 type:complete len:310 (-) comp12004_c0_seq1:15-944(-)